MNNGITILLDKVASSLEEKGLMKEAAAIDVIANTIEASGGFKGDLKFEKPKDPEIEKDTEFIKELESFAKKIESKYKDKKVPSFKIERILDHGDGSRLSGLIKTVPDEKASEGDHGTLDGFPGRFLYHFKKGWRGESPDRRRLRYVMDYLNSILKMTYEDHAGNNPKAPAVVAFYNGGTFFCNINLAPTPEKTKSDDSENIDF